MTRKKILIINKLQFGYHTDYLFFSRYLLNSFDLSYVCMDYNLKRIDMPGVQIEFVSRQGPKILRSFNFFRRIIKSIRSDSYDMILLYYFNSCSILKILFPLKRFILDIRTSAIKNTAFKRFLWNLKLRFEIKLFSNITVISKSLAEKIGLKEQQYHLVPLGAEEISGTPKTFSRFNLIYVGSFLKRNIYETIEGLGIFYKEYSPKINITYTIIGFGSDYDITMIKESIRINDLIEVVNLVGQVPFNELKSYFDNANIGISYVPITDYFDCQPPTKTFEYIMSGLYCVATDTQENRKVISAENGVLCKDTPDSFSKALAEIYRKRDSLDDHLIRHSLDTYKWENIINNNFINYINQLIDD